METIFNIAQINGNNLFQIHENSCRWSWTSVLFPQKITNKEVKSKNYLGLQYNVIAVQQWQL